MDKKANEIKSCWIITEGMAGTENQCLGVAHALDLNPEVMRVSLRQPWKTLSPYLKFECKSSFIPKLSPPWPDLLITSGRKSIAAARYIKKQSAGKTFTVHIQDPRIDPNNFDLVCIPEHDPTRGENVITTTAAPNLITPEKITQAMRAHNYLEKLFAPRIAVLIGGKSKAYKITAENTQNLVENLSNLKGSIMMTCSRRTGSENTQLLKAAFDKDGHFFWDGTGTNPYLAILGYADYILVTADSTSMLSDAASTGKPVYIIPLEGGTPRIKRMHQNLKSYGAARDFDGNLEPFTYKPLNDAKKIADEVKKRYALFTASL